MKLQGINHMNFNIIGAGNLGKNIALALSTAKIATLQSICNRNLHRATQACLDIGMGTPINAIVDLPPADVTWITSNDDSISTIVAMLAQSSLLKHGSIIIHCSGVLNSTLLDPLKKYKCTVASFHPLKAFRIGFLDAAAFDHVNCVLEGDDKACTWLKSSFEALGANLIAIKPEAKKIYHAAATMASNYLITLASCSEELLLDAGINSEHARDLICTLMQGNINNLKQTNTIADALTGPLMRGDINTIALHLQAIENSMIYNLYKAAGQATLPLTKLTDEQKQTIKNMFES